MTSIHRLLLNCTIAVMPILAVASTTPDADFIIHNDGTVTHKITGLMWKRCGEGQVWAGNTCMGAEKNYYWTRYLGTDNQDQAKTMTSNFAGYTDWRLPTITELTSIIDWDSYNPALNYNIFFGAPKGFDYWTSTADQNNGNKPFHVFFSRGDDADGYLFSLGGVRFVRGKSALDTSGEYTPAKDFTDNGDGTVTHTTTGLTWQRCSPGQSWEGNTCTGKAITYSFSDAKKQTSNLAGHTDWRLPTVTELISIVEYKHINPAVNPTIFPNIPRELWSSTPFANQNSATAWKVDFNNAVHNIEYTFFDFAIKFVRKGNGTTPTPVSDINTKIDALFNWAEKNYPDLFPEHQASIEIAGYHARYYPKTALYLGTKDGRVYLYGAQFSGLLDAGTLSSLLTAAGL